MNSLTWVEAFCHGLNKWQQKNLAMLMDAMFERQISILNELASAIAFGTGVGLNHCIKRLQRFLGNHRFIDEAVSRALIRFIWPRLKTWRYIPVVIDWTCNEKEVDKWTTLVASIPLRGRGIPLMAWSFPKGDLGGYLSQNRLEEAFLSNLLSLIPPEDLGRLVIIADRGFGRASLFRYLKKRNIHFVIRVKMNVSVKSTEHTGLLGEIFVSPYTLRSLGKTLYKAQGEDAVELRQLVICYQDEVTEDGAIDPWFLATDLSLSAKSIQEFYSKRMIIEEDLREAKSHLLWKSCRIRKAEHYQRFTTVLILVLALATLVGHTIHRRPTLNRLVSRKRQGKTDTSTTLTGLRFLKHSLDNLKYARLGRLPSPL